MFKVVDQHLVADEENRPLQPLFHAYFMSRREYWCKGVCASWRIENAQDWRCSSAVQVPSEHWIKSAICLRILAKFSSKMCRVCAHVGIGCAVEWREVGRMRCEQSARPTRASSVSHCMCIGCMDGRVSSRIRCALCTSFAGLHLRCYADTAGWMQRG